MAVASLLGCADPADEPPPGPTQGELAALGYNVHGLPPTLTEDDAARAANVEQVVEAMTAWSDGRAILAMADTNLEQDDPDEAPTLAYWMEAIGLSDACDEVACTEPGRIERVMFRDGESLELSVSSWVNAPGSSTAMESRYRIIRPSRWVSAGQRRRSHSRPSSSSAPAPVGGRARPASVRQSQPPASHVSSSP